MTYNLQVEVTQAYCRSANNASQVILQGSEETATLYI